MSTFFLEFVLIPFELLFNVIITKEIFDCTNMVFKFFGERKCFPNKSVNPLPNGIIKSWQMIGILFNFRILMPFFRKNTLISIPVIRIEIPTFLHFYGDFLPQLLCCTPTPIPNMKSDNLPRFSTLSYPNPLLIRLFINEWPYFIQLTIN